ncbi:actin protein Arp6 [Fomitopsis schrenkii]|uniref:Actin-like protein ARP6 n=1 Tax=Fomitopsis schrenkii TaxID=2126942 RepID=S8EJP1_FOMSC|nr:actin protein Arp6 [Fomitopsis schrenkii]
MKPSTVIILDNGASTIKAGVVGVHNAQPRVITNAIVRSKGDKATYIGHELEKCRDYSSLHYRLPFEKGYLTDWDAEKAIWDGLFSQEVLAVHTAESSLLITEPYFNLPNLQNVYDQFVFEEYDFQSYYRCAPASLIPHGELYAITGLPTPECMFLIDSGFSFTHVVPILDGAIVWNAVKRIDVGGKLLTNHLKELASFRQWNMMNETHIVNDIKETCCYVSTDFRQDMEASHLSPMDNPIVQEYVLPDFSANRPGRVRRSGEALDEQSQVMYMNNERFTVPEIIFRPNDIGLEQSGIASTVAHSIGLLPEDLQGMFWANIGLIGGNAKFPGFRERLESELRALAPVDCTVSIHSPKDPILEAYRSGVAFAKKPAFTQQAVTRAEYLEMGNNASRRKFRDWKPAPVDTNKGAEQPSRKGPARPQRMDREESPPLTRQPSKGKGKGRATTARR